MFSEAARTNRQPAKTAPDRGSEEKKSDNILVLDVLRTPFLALGVGVGIVSVSSPSPVAQSVAFALPKTDCWEDLDRIPPRGITRSR